MRRLALAFAFAGALVASAVASAQQLLDFSTAERALIAAHGPWPQPVARDASNRVDGQPAAIRLGRTLFFDKRLSRDGQFACATCHIAASAMQDGRVQALGRITLPRNTPSLVDTAQHRWWGWDGAHDTLWWASLTPMLAPAEMGQRADTAAALVRSDAALRRSYRQVFGALPGDDDERVVVDLAKALAAYQATLRSPRTAFDDFRDALQRGDLRAAVRYPIEAQRGLRLFVGEARCSVCHSGPTFTNGEFGDIGVPFFIDGGVDNGRHGGLTTLLESHLNRLGRYNDAGAADERASFTSHVLQQHRNFGEFRVPGLRQLTYTAPYMHNGSLASIEDVVRHYSDLDEDRLHADGERILRRLNLTPAQQADLTAFLRSLSTPVARRPRPQ